MPARETISIGCPCGFEGDVPSSYAGKAVKCTQCGKKLKVPPSRAAPEPPKGEIDDFTLVRLWIKFAGALLLSLILCVRFVVVGVTGQEVGILAVLLFFAALMGQTLKQEYAQRRA